MSLLAQQGMMMASSVNPTAQAIYSKLAEWWGMDALDGGNLVGLHNGTPLTRLNAPALAAGKIGNGVDFQTSSQQGLYYDNDPPGARTNVTPMTWGCWYKPRSLLGCSLVNVALRSNLNGYDRRLNLWLGADGKLIAMAGNGSTLFQAPTTNTASVGVFHFLQGEVVPGGELRARIDNGPWAAVTGPATLPNINLGVRMGMNRRMVNVFHEWFADGVLDEVFLLDAQLTADEWSYLYNGGAGMSYAALKAAAGH